MTIVKLTLSILPEVLAVCSLKKGSEIPSWALQSNFCSIALTSDEISVICPEKNVPDETLCDRGWRAFKVHGPLDLSLLGSTTSISAPLTKANINILAVATYDTDYILVREEDLGKATEVLREHHEIK